MTDKEKLDAIRAEIHRLVDVRGYDRGMANDLFAFMDSLPNEPVSKDLEEAAREWLKPKLDKSYINYGESKMMELTHFDGYAMLDATEFGAQWQKEQMEKEVDLEKEFDNYANGILACDIQFEPFTHLHNCAKHFYELGLKAKGE